MKELKSCPFCGSEEISAGAFSFSSDCHVTCDTCGAGIEKEVPWEEMNEKEHDEKCFELLKEAWNTRTE